MTAVCTLLASAPVTDWPERIGLTLGVIALIGVVLGLMRWGWVRRGRRQSDIDPLPAVPEIPGTPGEGAPRDSVDIRGVSARYLGATRSGDWLDRIVVHGLGVPSSAEVTVGSQGVWVLRSGAPDIFAAATDVVAARHDRGIAGRVLETDGVLVITWRHGGQHIDLGLRVRDALAAEELRCAVDALATNATNQSLPSDPTLSTTTSGDSA